MRSELLKSIMVQLRVANSRRYTKPKRLYGFTKHARKRVTAAVSRIEGLLLVIRKEESRQGEFPFIHLKLAAYPYVGKEI